MTFGIAVQPGFGLENSNSQFTLVLMVLAAHQPQLCTRQYTPEALRNSGFESKQPEASKNFNK